MVPGTYRMAEYDVFMIYLIDEQGNIVWSFQPMEDYDNLYALKGIQGKDLDGDGLKDSGLVFAKYSYEGEEGNCWWTPCAPFITNGRPDLRRILILQKIMNVRRRILWRHW